MRAKTQTIAKILATLMPPQQLATVINALLCAEDEVALTDFHASVAKSLFDDLCDRSPEAMAIASQGNEQFTGEAKAAAEEMNARAAEDFKLI